MEFRVRWFASDDEEEDEEFGDEEWDVDVEDEEEDDFLFTHEPPPTLEFRLNGILIRTFDVESLKFKHGSQKSNDRYLRLNIENMPYGLHVCGISLRSNNNASLAEDALEFRVVEKFDARRFVEDQTLTMATPRKRLAMR